MAKHATWPTGPGTLDEPWEVTASGSFPTMEHIQYGEEVIAVVKLVKRRSGNAMMREANVARHGMVIQGGWIVDDEAQANNLAEQLADRAADDPDQITIDEALTDMDES